MKNAELKLNALFPAVKRKKAKKAEPDLEPVEGVFSFLDKPIGILGGKTKALLANETFCEESLLVILSFLIVGSILWTSNSPITAIAKIISEPSQPPAPSNMVVFANLEKPDEKPEYASRKSEILSKYEPRSDYYSEPKCLEDKTSKQSSDLCGKDQITLEQVDRMLAPRIVVPAQPRLRAEMPNSFKRVNGRLVCDKKNDHPGKSKKNKGKHMDMECCLDPDEYPNPNCYYDSDKYGKYLK